jgi:hypothetical protein
MKRKNVSLKLARMSVSNKVEFARAIVAAMTGNLKFPTPTPTLSAISAAATNLENAITAAMDGGKSKTAAMRVKEKLLDDLLTQLGKYVDAIANGDESIILSSGMNAEADRTAPQIPDAPASLSAEGGSSEGVVELRWRKVKGAKVYIVEQCDDVTALQSRTASSSLSGPVAIWKQTVVVTKTKCRLQGLISGNKYAYRVYAVSAGGNGDYSDVVVVKVL